MILGLFIPLELEGLAFYIITRDSDQTKRSRAVDREMRIEIRE